MRGAPPRAEGLVQAGSSEDGKEFAARHAEAVFTAQQTLQEGQEFYADLKRRLAAYGRTRDELLVLPGISAIIGSTEREARALEQELEDLIIPAYGLAQLSHMTGLELTEQHLDGPLPEGPELRARGLFRHEYEARTLRANYGLPRPRSRYVTTQPVGA